MSPNPQDLSTSYEAAAVAVHAALLNETGRRKHAKNYKKHAAKVLGLRSIYPARWEEVLEAGRFLGLFTVDTVTLRHPFLVLGSGHEAARADLSSYHGGIQPEDVLDEDTSDDPTVETQVPPPVIKITAPPDSFACSCCAKPARLHWAAPVPDGEFYIDTDGRWKCATCAVLSFVESWGGVKKFAATYPGEVRLHWPA